MIFTIGNKQQYDSLIQERGSIKKGKTGSVWKTDEDAIVHLNRASISGFQIYGVEADWDLDTEEIKGESWRALNRSADIVVL